MRTPLHAIAPEGDALLSVEVKTLIANAGIAAAPTAGWGRTISSSIPARSARREGEQPMSNHNP